MKKTVAAVMLILALSALGAADDEPGENQDYRHGSLRLCAFWIPRFDSSIAFRADEIPVGVAIDLSRELGLGDALVVPRGFFTYRFSRRHQINLGYFKIDRKNAAVVDRIIEIGDEVIPIGSTVAAFSKVKVYKGSYTWLFYDNPKVTLGLSIGLNVVDFGLGLTVDAVDSPTYAINENTGVTAPLPILGFRVGYYPTPKLALVVATDTLALEYGDYRGTFHDTYALLDYRFAAHFSVGGGINLLNFDLAIEGNDATAGLNHNYRGVVVFVGVHF